ncbi:MAG TPA: hypothetical protein VI306_00785 [Pyrinomonadaceae bacterium]
MFIRLLVLFTFLFVLSSLTFAQADKDARYYEAAARKAYQEKNYEAFLDNIKLAAELRPNHPRLMYNLAVAYALNGKSSDAIAVLRKQAEMGLLPPVAANPDLRLLQTSPEFGALISRIAQNKEPKISSTPAFTLKEKGLVPESVAYDEDTGVFYLSSVYKRRILSVAKNGESKVFADETVGLWSVLGMKVDRARRALWVCTSAHPQMSNFDPADKGKTAIIKFDLKTGKLLARYQPADTTKPHFFGDLVINSAGDVFTTDSATPIIYVIKHDSSQIETFLEGPPFVSLQGLDFTPDQKQMFVADYSMGVFLIDLTTKKVREIKSDFTQLGIDGLYYYKGSLIGVQNGVDPQRVIKMTLSKDLGRFNRFEIIEVNNPVFDEPTLGVLVKDEFYFVANSQWGMVDETGKLAPEEKLKDPVVLKVKLSVPSGTR